MARKIRPTRRDSAPTVLVTVGAESVPAPWDDKTGAVPFILERCTVSVSRRIRGKWSTVRSHTFKGWRDVWDCIDAVGKGGRRVYVVTTSATDVLTQLHFWERVERKELSISHRTPVPAGKGRAKTAGQRERMEPLIMSDKCEIIGYRCNGVPFRWVSVTNWASVSLAEIADQVGLTPPDTSISLDKWASCGWPSHVQADLMMRYMQRLISWWLASNCGTWKDSPGAAAWSSFLRQSGETGIVSHNDPVAMEIEDKACFGGRASVFYLGDIGDTERWKELHGAPEPSRIGFGLPGPIHRYDMRAMYPSILRDERFPVRLLRVEHRIGVSSLKSLLKHFLCVATVQLSTKDAFYPYRRDTGVEYPVGLFRTTLATPELLLALQRGHVRTVDRVCIYTPGNPFAKWAKWVLHLRSTLRTAGDKAGEAGVKTLANSLGGRLARKPVGWVDAPKIPPKQWWGEWPMHDRVTGEWRLFRSICGRVQERIVSADRPGTLAACYAHLTSYGRVRMNAIRELVGKRDVVWQDTDGIYVTDYGRGRLEKAKGIVGCEYGQLRFEATISNARFITAKHYWTDGQWIVAGIKDGFDATDWERVESEISCNPARSAIDPEASAVYRTVRLTDLSEIEPGIVPGHDGWAIPPRVWRGEPEPERPKGQLTLEGEESWPVPASTANPSPRRRSPGSRKANSRKGNST